MGSYLSLNLEEQYKRNEKFLQSLNEIAMERQIQLKNQMAQRKRAMEIAKNRDIFLYSSTFFVAAAVGLFTGKRPRLGDKNEINSSKDDYHDFRRTKRAYFLFPLLPLAFVNLYYYDLGYGNKMHRIRMEAEHVMTHESDMLELPCGLPTPSSIDQGRMEEEEKKKIHPPLP